MPCASSLSDYEQGIIMGMHENGYKIAEIATRLNRHRNCVSRFLKNSAEYGTAPRSGRKTKIDNRCERRIRRLAVGDSMSSGEIRAHMALQITSSRIIHKNHFIKHNAMMPKPKLLERHIKVRLEFANKYQYMTDEWHNVVFSDKKNLI
ncbi:uncharacterized protein LOC119662932 [Teleopsis dalmanni]|nr:uncharacterized protein LOC119662932 [Teleopsis dalmanni]